MVIHTPADGTTQYSQFDDLGSAVQFIEEQRNAGVDDTALFEMREIPLAVKSYFKVEVADAAPEAPAAPTPVPEAAVAAPAPAPAVVEPAVVEPELAPAPTVAETAAIDDVSYVEAAMASPIDAFANEAPPLADLAAEPVETVPAASEGRRGLFGR
jgi:hypothetical protein